MKTSILTHSLASRRDFLGSAAAFAAGMVLPRFASAAEATKPNSVFNGVRIGCITYSYRGEVSSAEDTLKALIEDGLSEVEIGWTVASSHWRQGIGTLLGERALDEVAPLGLHSVIAYAREDNPASHGVMRNLATLPKAMQPPPSR